MGEYLCIYRVFGLKKFPPAPKSVEVSEKEEREKGGYKREINISYDLGNL